MHRAVLFVWCLLPCLTACQRNTTVFGRSLMSCAAASHNGTVMAADFNHQELIEAAVCQAAPVRAANWKRATLQTGVDLGAVGAGVACGFVGGQPCVVSWSDGGLVLRQFTPAQAAPWVSRPVATDLVCFLDAEVVDLNGQACVVGSWNSIHAPAHPFELGLMLLTPAESQTATADFKPLFELNLDQDYGLFSSACVVEDKVYVTYHDVQSGSDPIYRCQVFSHQTGAWERSGWSVVGMNGPIVRSSNLVYHDGLLQLLLVDNDLHRLALFSASPLAAIAAAPWQETMVSPDAKQVALLALDSVGDSLYAGYAMNAGKHFVTGGFKLDSSAQVTRQQLIDRAVLKSQWPHFLRLVDDGSQPYLVVTAADLGQRSFADDTLRVLALN